MKLLLKKGCYEVIECSRGKSRYLVKNPNLPYEKHAHFDDYKGALDFIDIVSKGILPSGRYFREAARRVLTDKAYSELRKKRKKDKCVKRKV